VTSRSELLCWPFVQRPQDHDEMFEIECLRMPTLTPLVGQLCSCLLTRGVEVRYRSVVVSPAKHDQLSGL
jgi:hypothetical protein